MWSWRGILRRVMGFGEGIGSVGNTGEANERVIMKFSIKE